MPLTLGESEKQVAQMVDFMVVDCSSAYNDIIGRTTLDTIQAVVSTHHLKMKFLTLVGVREVKGDQKVARECYATSMKQAKWIATP